MTLVEMALVVLISAMLMSVLWNLLGGGMRQSSVNLGRTEALMSALLVLDTLDEDLHHVALARQGDPSLFASAPGPTLEFLAALPAGSSPDQPMAGAARISYRLAPTTPSDSILLRNGRPIRGVRIRKLLFVPRKIGAGGQTARYFLQTFLTTVDSSGHHTLSLMGLCAIGVVNGDRAYPYWNPNPDPVPYLKRP